MTSWTWMYQHIIVMLIAILVTVQPSPAYASSQGRSDKVVYFTFDDGPSATYTPKVLDVLHREHVHATFFLVGSRCQESPMLVQRIRAEGHEVGNHGYFHHDLRRVPIRVMAQEVEKTDVVIMKACGSKPVYFRPPGGLMNPSGYGEIHRLGHRMVLWTVDSVDHKAQTSTEIVQNVVRTARPGAVILFHDGITPSKYTAEALPKLIHYFRDKGYTFDVLPVGHTTFKVF
jgi:peptidoglycan-N-acetylglucosamine deacetylase